VLVTALLLLAACSSGSSTVNTAPTVATTTVPVVSGPGLGHVFVINLENKNYATT